MRIKIIFGVETKKPPCGSSRRHWDIFLPFGFAFKDIFVVPVQFWPGDNHLATQRPTGSVVSLAFCCTCSLWMTCFLLPGPPCQFADLCTVLTQTELNILLDGHGLNVILLTTWKEGKAIFPCMWEDALKCLSGFLLWSEVGGIKLHFDCCCFSNGRQREKKADIDAFPYCCHCFLWPSLARNTCQWEGKWGTESEEQWTSPMWAAMPNKLATKGRGAL